MLYNKNNLAVAAFASKSDVRPEIAGVLFTSKKTVATDSYRLLEVSTPSDMDASDFPTVRGNIPLVASEAPFIVSAKTIKGIKIKKNKRLPILETVALSGRTNESINFISTDLETTDVINGKIIDRKYPDYEQLFPTEKLEAEIVISGDLLGELLKAMASMNDKTHVTMKIYGKNRPIVLLGGTENQPVRGIIMPIRQ